MLPEEETGQRWNQMLAELLMLGGRSNSYFLRLSCSRGRALPASVKSEQNSRKIVRSLSSQWDRFNGGLVEVQARLRDAIHIGS